VDNDGDAKVDFPQDPDCANAADESERRPPRGAHRFVTFTPLEAPSGYRDPWPIAVSGDGSVVVGGAAPVTNPGSWEASVVWRDGVPEIIDVIPGPPAGEIYRFLSMALGISDDGSTVVGTHQIGNFGTSRAYRYREGVLTDLDLPGTGPFESWSAAIDASDDGTVVGAVGTQAVRWDDGVPTYISPYVDNAPGVEARGITPDGSVIVGSNPDVLAHYRRVARWSGSDPNAEVLDPYAFESYPWCESWPECSRYRSHTSHGESVSSDGSVIVGSAPASAPGELELGFWWEDGAFRMLGGTNFATGSEWMNLAAVAAAGSRAVGTGYYSGPIVVDRERVRSLEDLLVNDYGVDLEGWDLTIPDDYLWRRQTYLSADGRTIVGRGVAPGGSTGAWVVRLPPACSDALDNDGDGRVDFPDDPGCARPMSETEDAACDARGRSDGRPGCGDRAEPPAAHVAP